MMRCLSIWRWRIRPRLQRCRRALAYAMGRLSPDDAQWLLIDCQPIAGWYPLTTLCEGDVFGLAADRYGDAADALAPYIPAACERVAGKWETPCDDGWHARNWAIEIALEYAAQDGVLIKDNEDNPGQSQPEESAHV